MSKLKKFPDEEFEGKKLRKKLKEEMNIDALLDLEEGLPLGMPKKISRDKLYATNRY